MSPGLLLDLLNEKLWQAPRDLHLTVPQLALAVYGLYFKKTMECGHWGQTYVRFGFSSVKFEGNYSTSLSLSFPICNRWLLVIPVDIQC